VRLEGKVALVTGAGGGLGTAISTRFAGEGASVLCADCDLAAAEKTALAIVDAGGVASAFRADVADADECVAQVEETVRRSGRIIQIGSISGQRGNMGGIAYGSSKAAVMHVCKVLAVELSSKGVMVNAIAPGPIETGISNHGPTRKRGYLERIPTGSYGMVTSVANAALFLASDECEWITGHVLNVDGGYGGAGLAYDPAEVGGVE
jgi:NAD(P)-dependent dehydrogenase (short-subunit alcohol dehydrogenase family)